MDTFTLKNENLMEKSKELKSELGAIAWATLEMMKRGGMPPEKLKQLKEDMDNFFAKPSNEECNLILRFVEQRLMDDKDASGAWY